MVGSHYLELSSNPLKFEAVSKARLNNVFFDDCNNQVFSVQSSDVTEVVVKSPSTDTIKTFQMEEKGPVISIKFSPDHNILAVQRTRSSVEFINFINSNQSREYSQSCEAKNGRILGFIWTNSTEIVFVTDQGVEMYKVDPVKFILKAVKTISLNVNWFIYCPRSCLLLLSSGAAGNSIQLVYIKQSNLIKLNRFEIELSVVPKPTKLSYTERDLTIGMIYDQPRILVLQHQRSSMCNAAEVIVYTVQKMTSVTKKNVLKLDRNGRFAINIIDNLIVVHHQASKTSLLYDIRMEAEYDGSVYYHCPVASPKPIYGVDCELYSPNWVPFQPDLLVDAKLGKLWYIQLDLEPFTDLIQDKCFLVDFLMMRSNSKYVILSVLQNIAQNNSSNLEEIAKMFDRLNFAYRNSLLANVPSQLGLPMVSTEAVLNEVEFSPKVIIDQSDMYLNVLTVLADKMNTKDSTKSKKFVIWVQLEYIRSLIDHHIPIQHYLHELIINSLVLNKSYYQLHQLLQYYVVSDSKPLACLLLSLENLYPAAHQLAVDMLARLSDANEEITEVLLSKHQILPALRYNLNLGIKDQISERKFLEVANTTKDLRLIHSVTAFFENRTQNVNGSLM
uniref:Uncharacterized protein n=2 Tax=Clastoptera arizonana TaxID=38151 RepID=A0A1B6C0U7_9HEMI